MSDLPLGERIVFACYRPFKGGAVHWRGLMPANALGAYAIMRETSGAHLYGEPPDDPKGRLLVYQQPTVAWHIREIQDWQRGGGKVVVTCDDALWSIRKRSDHMKRDVFTKKVDATLNKAIGLADGLVVTTSFLKRKLKKHLKPGCPVFEIPNMVDTERYEWSIWEPDGVLRVGFEGSTAHRLALEAIMPAVVSVMREYPDVVLRLVGEDYRSLVPRDLRDRLEYEHFTHDLKAYPELIRPMDIGLAPSLANDYYRAKSPLRLYEYGMALAAAVACGPTYEPDLVGSPPPHTILWSEDASGVEANLAALVGNPALREQYQQQLGDWVRSECSVEAVKPLWERMARRMLDG